MDVTPHELRTVELPEGWRGYRQDDVDELLDRVAGTIERLQAQVHRLSERLANTEEEVGLGRQADEMLRRTLLLAQRTADAAVAEAQERARRVLVESEAQAESILTSAEEEARRVVVAERQRLDDEVRELSRRRETLLADVEHLERSANDYRRRVREHLEEELAALDTRTLPEPPERPEPPPDLTAGESVPDGDDELPAVHPATGTAVSADVPTEWLSLADIEAEEGSGEEHSHDVEPAAPEAWRGAAEAPEAPDAPEADLVDLGAPGDEGAGEPREVRASGEGDDRDDFDDLRYEEPRVSDLLPRRRRRRRRAEEGPSDDYFADLRRAVEENTPLGPSDDPDRDEHAEHAEHVEATLDDQADDDRDGRSTEHAEIFFDQDARETQAAEGESAEETPAGFHHRP